MKLKLLVLVLALQTAWILATTFTQERALASGTVITLETVPVDPRDLLRGDYKRHEYGQVILPFTLLRRLDCVLAPTRDAVRTAAS